MCRYILILDLYGEKEPNYNDGHSNNPYHGYSKEFDASPWVFYNLNNFGGRLGLHGHLDTLAKQIPEVFNSCSHIYGIGITPEALITTWGAYNQSEIGGLHDYSNRQWSGLISTFYKARWNLWIDERLCELQSKPNRHDINWFEWEWNWARRDTLYTVSNRKTDMKLLAENILELHF